MKRFSITIKEKGGAILHPSYYGNDNLCEADMVSFFGLNEPDVESYSIKVEQL